MTLKLVTNNRTNEVHSVFIDDGAITVVDIESGENVSLSEFQNTFNGFEDVLSNAVDLTDLIARLGDLNLDYQWAHVSGKI